MIIIKKKKACTIRQRIITNNMQQLIYTHNPSEVWTQLLTQWFFFHFMTIYADSHSRIKRMNV